MIEPHLLQMRSPEAKSSKMEFEESLHCGHEILKAYSLVFEALVWDILVEAPAPVHGYLFCVSLPCR
jgi:hypothetical protein